MNEMQYQNSPQNAGPRNVSRQRDIRQVLEALHVPYKDRKEIVIDCPVCGGRGKLGINAQKGVWHCVRCDERGGDVQLYGALRYGLAPSACKRQPEDSEAVLANKRAQYGKLARELDDLIGKQEAEGNGLRKLRRNFVPDPEPAPVQRRDEVYRAMLNLLELNAEDRENLRKRGLSDLSIASGNYRSLPEPGSPAADEVVRKLLDAGHHLEGIPGFYQKDGSWKMVFGNGFLIPSLDVSGIIDRGVPYIQGFQIRSREANAKPRYTWFSSASREQGTGAKSWCHTAGYPEPWMYLTEGGLKADIIHALSSVPTIAVMGVNATSQLPDLLASLKKAGVEHIEIAFDMDYQTNPNVQKALLNMQRLLENAGLEWSAAPDWDPQYKGYDDYLLHLAQQKKPN